MSPRRPSRGGRTTWPSGTFRACGEFGTQICAPLCVTMARHIRTEGAPPSPQRQFCPRSHVDNQWRNPCLIRCKPWLLLRVRGTSEARSVTGDQKESSFLCRCHDDPRYSLLATNGDNILPCTHLRFSILFVVCGASNKCFVHLLWRFAT